jgi:hypothetical protein
LGSLGAPESPKPAPEVVQPEPGTPIATEKPKKCDGIDYWYNPVGGCPSGFVGCMSRKDYCSGTQRFWGTCPPELGNYYVCSNGFRGCTRDTSICDKPAFAKE